MLLNRYPIVVLLVMAIRAELLELDTRRMLLCRSRLKDVHYDRSFFAGCPKDSR